MVELQFPSSSHTSDYAEKEARRALAIHARDPPSARGAAKAAPAYLYTFILYIYIYIRTYIYIYIYIHNDNNNNNNNNTGASSSASGLCAPLCLDRTRRTGAPSSGRQRRRMPEVGVAWFRGKTRRCIMMASHPWYEYHAVLRQHTGLITCQGTTCRTVGHRHTKSVVFTSAYCLSRYCHWR